jgi:hypothetical protein
LVTTPHERGNGGGHLEEPTCLLGVIAHPLRAPDGLIGVGENAVAPTPDLISKRAQSSKPPTSDSAFHDNASRPGVGIRAWPHCLHDKTSLGNVDLEGRVVDGAWPAVF